MTAPNPWPAVTYVMPVLNEAEYVGEAIESVLSQDYAGSKEIVLALGPSSDATNEIVYRLAAHDPRVRWVDNPAGRTPAGLNAAIRATTSPIVIRVDAHSVLDPSYTSQGVSTLLRTGAADVGGRMAARGRNPLQRAVAAAYNSPMGLGGAAYHSGAPEGETESAYLGIFRRSIFEDVGLFDETLWRGQDWEMCLRIRQANEVVWFDPALSTTYFPRDDYRNLAAQSYASGVWRGELARRYKDGKSLRHVVPPLMTVAVAVGSAAWLAAPKRLPTLACGVVRTLRAAPLVYAALIAAVALRADLPNGRERFHLLRVLPTIHFPWAWGFVRGRLRGAGRTTDQSRTAKTARSEHPQGPPA